jgi:glycine/betaine/sarcosine/D-proline reductase family selenoprotein B
MTPVAMMVGSNRVIPGAGIVHPVGNPDLGHQRELDLRMTIVEKALQALQTDIKEQKLFSRDY